jgi:hypothetical protein
VRCLTHSREILGSIHLENLGPNFVYGRDMLLLCGAANVKKPEAETVLTRCAYREIGEDEERAGG